MQAKLIAAAENFLNIWLILRSKDDESEIKPEEKPTQKAEPKPIQLKEPEKMEEVDSAIESESSSLRSSSSESSFESESKEVETEDFGIDEDTELIEDFEEEPIKEVSCLMNLLKKPFLKFINFEIYRPRNGSILKSTT